MNRDCLKKIARQLSLSDSTIKSFRDDFHWDSLCNRNKHRKKIYCSNAKEILQTRDIEKMILS